MPLTRSQIERHFGRFSWFDHPKTQGAVVIRPPWAAQHIARVTPPFEVKGPVHPVNPVHPA